MESRATLRWALVGDGALALHCATDLTERGQNVAAMVTSSGPLRDWAASAGVPVLAPGASVAPALDALAPDVLLSVTNLTRLPEAVLSAARVAAVNFHDGPLPERAGLFTTSWAILEGADEHGVSWHLMTAELDAGNVLAERRFPVGPRDTAYTLNARCFEAGLESFPELVGLLCRGDTEGRRQVGQGRMHRRSDPLPDGGVVNWARPAIEIDRLVRALDTGPSHRCELGAARLVAGSSAALVRGTETATGSGLAAGTVVSACPEHLRVATGRDDLTILALADVDGTEMSIADFIARAGVRPGDALTELSDEARQTLARVAPVVARTEKEWVSRLSGAATLSWPRPEPTLGSGLHRLPLSSRVTEPCLLLAAVAGWCSRRTNQHRFLLPVRTPWHRSLGELSPLFPPTGGLTVDLSPDCTGVRIAGGLRAEAELVTASPLWWRDLAARYESVPARGMDEVDVVVELGVEVAGPVEFTVAPISIVCHDDGEAWLQVDGSVYDEGTATRFGEELSAALAAAGTDIPVGGWPLLSEGDRALLARWNDTGGPFDSTPVTVMIARRAAAHPSAVAISSSSRSLDYRSLWTWVSVFADDLRQRGIGPGSVVGIALPRSIEMVVALLAVLESGAAYLPLDLDQPPDRLALMIEDSGAEAIIGTPHGVPGSGSEPLVVTGRPARGELTPPSTTPAGPHDLAYVIYTSGSTGRPKGVEVSHANMANFLAAMDRVIDHDDPGVWLAVTSLSFDISVLELLWTLARGFHVVLAGEQDPTPAVSRPLDFSLFYFATAESGADADAYRLLLDGARFADAHGFAAVWVPERHFHAFGGLYPNPSVLAAAVSTVTENISIRAGSVVLPLHSPIRVAEEWAVVDNLSGGRVAISFASGWHPADFVLRPDAYQEARSALAEGVDTVRRLWRGEEMIFAGPVDDVPVRTLPRPVQEELPTWLTSAGTAETFELAGRIGAGLLTHLLGQSVDELIPKVERYRQAWRDAGHPGRGHVSVMVHTYVSDTDADAFAAARGPMKAYLRSSIGLIRNASWAFPIFNRPGGGDHFEALSEDEADQLAEAAVDRYLTSHGLFGSPDTCTRFLERLGDADVDEVACLIDFGVETDTTLHHLHDLARLKDHHRAAPRPTGGRLAAIDSVVDQVAHHGVTHLQCTPSHLAMLLAESGGPEAVGSLQHLLVGGEALPPDLAARARSLLGGRFTNMYGPTETTVWSASQDVTSSEGPVPIGRPLLNTVMEIRDPQRALAPLGSWGELHIGGAGVARGYRHRPQLTADRFWVSSGGTRFYATGDLCRWLPDGTLQFGGRLDDQVKLRGHRIELGEIEARLARHEAVAGAVVAARSDRGGVCELVGYVTLHPDHRTAEAELVQWCARALPPVMVPSRVVVLDSFPYTHNGKVARSQLPAPAARAESARSGAPAETEIESWISAVWQELLGVERVFLDDNFFDLGGHSLLAVELFRRISKRIPDGLVLTDVFRYPTVRTLAGHLAGHGEPERVNAGQARANARLRAMHRREGDRSARRS